MISLIDDGIAVRTRSSEDCVTFGIRLQQAVNEFTSAFLPHMKQEEEVFQVMNCCDLISLSGTVFASVFMLTNSS
jgi:predicted DNA-binding protein with PD1-like motif